jgi:hypothetical protein
MRQRLLSRRTKIEPLKNVHLHTVWNCRRNLETAPCSGSRLRRGYAPDLTREDNPYNRFIDEAMVAATIPPDAVVRA